MAGPRLTATTTWWSKPHLRAGDLTSGIQGRRAAMHSMSRRGMLTASVGFAATGALSRPYIANAAGTTAVVWVIQGFVQEEDAAFRKTVADYEKQSGNKLDYSIMPFQALNQKAISAITSGEVPDLIFHDAPQAILPQN